MLTKKSFVTLISNDVGCVGGGVVIGVDDSGRGKSLVLGGVVSIVGVIVVVVVIIVASTTSSGGVAPSYSW